MDSFSGASLETIRKRALIFRKIRTFFLQRDLLEVETPSLSFYPSLDLHIDPFSLITGEPQKTSYLVTSPEFHMKRLLSRGIGSIYQICKAFRRDEAGAVHNPEFSMIEWYRVDWDQWQLMEEVDLFFHEVLNCGKAERISYRDIFKTYFDIDPFKINRNIFLQICERNHLIPPVSLRETTTDPDSWLHYLMGIGIEPRLNKKKPLIIHSFPLSQSTLSEPDSSNPDVSTRFEYYYQGMELANGCSELRSGKEQQIRFEAINRLRKIENKKQLEIDINLIHSLNEGMPKCVGVAVGLDRLVMIALGKEQILQVLAFPWEQR